MTPIPFLLAGAIVKYVKLLKKWCFGSLEFFMFFMQILKHFRIFEFLSRQNLCLYIYESISPRFRF